MSLTFSQRMGLEPKKAIQVDSLDERTRRKIYNAFYKLFFLNYNDTIPNLNIFYNNIWNDYFAFCLDEKNDWDYFLKRDLKKYILENDYNKIFDLIEFIIQPIFNASKTLNLAKERALFFRILEIIFKEECVSYSIINGLIAPITSESEITSIEQALQTPIDSVKEYLKTALKHLSDREHPDYRNSIKESISAVECFCRYIIDDKKKTLGDALNVIKKEGKLQIHPCEIEVWHKHYGYACEVARHGGPEIINIDQEDALYMLVSCSAFINYLITKCNKTGIKLK